MTDFPSYLPSHAEILRSACLELLGQPDALFRERYPVVDFALALHDRVPAEKLLELYREMDSPGIIAVSALIRRLLEQGNIEQAVRLFDDIDPVALAPNECVLYAELLAERGDYEAALSYVARACSEDHSIKDARSRIAWKVFWPKQEYDKLIEWMEMDAAESVSLIGKG